MSVHKDESVAEKLLTAFCKDWKSYTRELFIDYMAFEGLGDNLLGTYHPLKEQVIVSKATAGWQYLNTMRCSTYLGEEFTKIIYIDEQNKAAAQSAFLVNKKGKCFSSSDPQLTRVRCGMTVSLAIAMYFKYQLSGDLTVGIIGNGPMAKVVGHIVEAMGLPSVGIDSKEGRQSVIYKKLEEAVIIVSATNNGDIGKRHKVPSADLVISLDGGWGTEPTARSQRHMYSDYPNQLLRHYASEFPGENAPNQISYMSDLLLAVPKKAFVAIHGLAALDAFTIRKAWEIA